MPRVIPLLWFRYDRMFIDFTLITLGHSKVCWITCTSIYWKSLDNNTSMIKVKECQKRKRKKTDYRIWPLFAIFLEIWRDAKIPKKNNLQVQSKYNFTQLKTAL